MYLKRVRKEKRVTLKELSRLTGISVTTLSDLENGLRVDGGGKLEKIANALGVSIKDLRGY